MFNNIVLLFYFSECLFSVFENHSHCHNQAHLPISLFIYLIIIITNFHVFVVIIMRQVLVFL